MNIEDGFLFKKIVRNGRKRCLKCSAGSTSGEVEIMQRRAVAVFA